MKNWQLGFIASLLMLIASMTACNFSKSDNDLFSMASSHNTAIIGINGQALLENCGCTIEATEIAPSEALKKLLRSYSDIFSFNGIDLSCAILAINQEDKGPIYTLTFRITDVAEFTKYIKNISRKAEMHEEGGYTVIELDKEVWIFMKDEIASLFHSPKISFKAFEEYKRTCSEKPVELWQKNILTKGNAINAVGYIAKCKDFMPQMIFTQASYQYDESSFENGYFTFWSSVNGLKITGESMLTDSLGYQLMPMKSVKNVDTSLLKYANKSDVAVFMTILPDSTNWNRLLTDITISFGMRGNHIGIFAIPAIAPILEDINGTIMLAFGPKDLKYENSLKGWDAILAAQMEPETAAHYVNQILKYASEFRLASKRLADESYSIEIERQGTVYVKEENGTLLVSLSPISHYGNCIIKADEFNNKCSGFIAKITKDNIITEFEDMPFGLDISYTSNGEAISLNAQQTNIQGLFFENIINYIANL